MNQKNKPSEWRRARFKNIFKGLDFWFAVLAESAPMYGPQERAFVEELFAEEIALHGYMFEDLKAGVG